MRETRDAPECDGIEVDEFELAVDDAYWILSDARRRHVVDTLREYDGAMSVADLAAEVATAEEGAWMRLSEEESEHVYESLTLVHLPLLHDHRVVDMVPDIDGVEPGDSFEELCYYLRSVMDE